MRMTVDPLGQATLALHEDQEDPLPSWVQGVVLLAVEQL